MDSKTIGYLMKNKLIKFKEDMKKMLTGFQATMKNELEEIVSHRLNSIEERL